ncbi:vWA domain-containing protein [Dactylosporangium matsuzakiense]|uniref:VWA domain-containing protein n=1 Tax=Dactylosporangium matsuzakiense TaxID=53360 RepID=A0A9W6KMM2_9ACTN|nr:substrate-binding domain-containing protein [Dactylosporangium matsuzakiense]UWZ42674.1 substrate-binding domain-containing protein [Dactylosporangium matsuzakiense]GLL03847.1 VWA domain-containing protein [Dactylosporangium matsuzakiense]
MIDTGDTDTSSNGSGNGNGDNGRETARPIVSILVALFTGAGISLQQLSTGQPASFARWAMLIGGSLIGGLGGLFAAGLFESLLKWFGQVLGKFRSILRWRALFVGVLCLVALAAGYAVKPAIDSFERWIHGCPRPAGVRVLTSQEQLDAVRQLADAYESATAAANHGCPTAELYVYAARPADARDAIGSGWSNDALGQIGPRPDVWLPDSTADIDAARDAAAKFAVPVPIAEQRIIAASPIVLGVPAAAVPGDLADRREDLTWKQLWDEVTRRGWDVLRPDPSVSGAGALATTVLYDRTHVDGPAARTVEQRIERSLDAGGFPLGDSTELLCRKRAEDPHRAAVLTTEQALVRYNQGLDCGFDQGRPGSEASLVAFYPTDTAGADHPLARLGWDTTAAPSTAAAKDLEGWLGRDEGKRALVRAALRPPPLFDVAEPLTERFGAHAGIAFERRPPPGDLIRTTLQRYAQARRPGRVLLALDVSGSMQTLADGRRTRYEVAASGVGRALDLMSGRDEFGLRVFPADGRGTGSRDIVPLGRADVPISGVPRAKAAIDALGQVRPGGNTPLLPTIADGVRDAAAGKDEQIAGLVVLTDGSDTSGTDPSSVDAQVRGKGVRVFVIAIGEASCGAFALKDITAHTGGACYDADPGAIGDILQDLFGLLWGGEPGNGT